MNEYDSNSTETVSQGGYGGVVALFCVLVMLSAAIGIYLA